MDVFSFIQALLSNHIYGYTNNFSKSWFWFPRVPYPANIFIPRHMSKRFSPLSYSLSFISKIYAKFVSRPINSLARAYKLHVRLPPLSLLVFPLHYFFFAPPSLSCRRLSLPLSSFQLSLQGWTFTRRNDSTQALYTSKHTSYRIRIVTMIRKRSACKRCCVSIDHRCNVSSFQWCNAYVYVSFAFQEAMMLINFPCTRLLSLRCLRTWKLS